MSVPAPGRPSARSAVGPPRRTRPASVLARDLERLAPGLGRRRAWWLREVLARDPGADCPPLRGSTSTDVVVIGGGFTGLWTAWNLVERAPGIRVTVVERDVVGGGASGRNGGFVTGLWDALPALVRSFGEEGALAVARAAGPAPAAIAAWCATHGVDVSARPGGMLLAATSPAQDGAWEGLLALGGRLGVDDRLAPLAAEEVRRRCASPVLRAGILAPDDITVQPAALARGLRRVLLERGVAIHEGTQVRRLRPGRAGARHVVEAEGGAIAADQAVLALNAWAAGWPGFGARLVTWSSYMVLTEPIPDRLAELGWTGGEGITDARFTNH
jgi:glycine/D-amino acid oxidase-like deaminating enzyme